MNIVTTVIKSRHSVRKFKPDSLNENAIKDSLECAALAPTAKNIQPWLFGVIKDKGMLQKIADYAENGKFIKDCAACFAIFGEKNETYYLEDCSAATENLILALQAYGISTCWVAGDKKQYADSVRELLGVPDKYTLVSLVPAGNPAEVTIARKKDTKNIVFFEAYKIE
jgi:nitroreductase